jgi:quercetin dioxygenase-like cupin family protein
MHETMKPRDAAKIFDRLDANVLLWALSPTRTVCYAPSRSKNQGGIDVVAKKNSPPARCVPRRGSGRWQSARRMRKCRASSAPSSPRPTCRMENVAVEIDPGVVVPRYTHAGVESAYCLGGSAQLSVKGQPDRMVKAGDGFQVPTETPHGAKVSDQPFKLVVTYTVEKDKPLATNVAE